MPDYRPRFVERRGAPALIQILSAASFIAMLTIGQLDHPGPSAAHADPSNDAGVRSEPIESLRVEVEPGQRLEVVGLGHYLDVVEFRPTQGVMINELPMEEYVAGIAEMPASWPLEALKAQAVAARTYAWYVQRLQSYEGFDICATVSCQVYRGASDDEADRWRHAVAATAGEVLTTSDGLPILARYFSTSGGRTSANEDVFPSTGAKEYLVSIDDPFDEVSPFHRWQVRFERDDFNRFATRGERLAAVVPIANIQRLGPIDDPSAMIRVEGIDGSEIEVSAADLRDFLSRVAAEELPERYPPLRADGGGRLPSTVPTARYDIRVDGDEVVIDGRGFGHGVGLGQYGARGRADQGHTYREILAAYYNGRVPSTAPDLPDRIRVGIDIATPLRFRSDGPMGLLVDGEQAEARALGSWELVSEDSGWQLIPPEGHGEALEVGPTTDLSESATDADAVVVAVEVNKPVELSLQVTQPDGTVVVDRLLGVVEGGRHRAVWRFDDGQGSLVDPGRYRIGLFGEDHLGQRDGTPIDLTVPAEHADERGWSRWPSSVATFGLLGSLAAAAVLVVTAFVVVIRRDR